MATNIPTMASKNFMVFLVMAITLVALASSVSAFGTITDVEVNGAEALSGTPDLSNFAGQTIQVRVTFVADNDPALDEDAVVADDVRVKAWFLGEQENAASSGEFAVLNGNQYTFTVNLEVPHDLDDELDENRKLRIAVENDEEAGDEVTIDFTVQRESYNLNILAVDSPSEIKAGESLAVDVVLKNRGRKFADDAFLKVTIPELGIQTTTYFGDLSATDQSDPDKEDAVERRTYLRIPVNTPAGLYTVQLEAFNDDSYVTAEKKVLVNGASDGVLTVPSSTGKTFSVGETEEYMMTLVNRGSTIGVYTLDVTSPENLNVDVSDSIIVVPAGSSRTVSIFADSSVRDDYTFTVRVNSEEGALVTQETFVANVIEGGRTSSGSSGVTGTTANATVLLTVILAIIFIVLLVVLIVLLTRKPDTKEEYGESYY